MKSELFVKLPASAMFDPRMGRLMDKEGVKGTGAYWYIREKIAIFRDDRFRLEDLKHFARKGITFKYMVKVVTQTGLFCTDGRSYWPDELNRMDDCAPAFLATEERGTSETTDKKAANVTEKRGKTSDEICPKKFGCERNLLKKSSQQREFCQNFEQKNDSKSKIHDLKRPEKTVEYGGNKLKISPPSRTNRAVQATLAQKTSLAINRKKERKKILLLLLLFVDDDNIRETGKIYRAGRGEKPPGSEILRLFAGRLSAVAGRMPPAAGLAMFGLSGRRPVVAVGLPPEHAGKPPDFPPPFGTKPVGFWHRPRRLLRQNSPSF